MIFRVSSARTTIILTFSADSMGLVPLSAHPSFLQTCGYAAFHFTDARYRMSEFVDRTENLGLEGAQELRKFYDIAKAGSDNGSTWAFPSLQDMITNHHK